jgi:hypothetical protein
VECGAFTVATWGDFDAIRSALNDILLRMIRPTGNVLPGYVPSYAMNRVVEETL